MMQDTARNGRAASYIMYGLYAASLFAGFPVILGAIVAYFTRSGAHPIYRSHLNYGISGFWVIVLLMIIAIVVTIITFGLLGWIAFGIVWLYTLWITVRGGIRLLDERPAPGHG